MSYEEVLVAFLDFSGRRVRVEIGSRTLGGETLAAFEGLLPPASELEDPLGEGESYWFSFEGEAEARFKLDRALFDGAEGGETGLVIRMADVVLSVWPLDGNK